jgi:spore coat polysaccharide biosynthesis protein SpsF
VKTLVVVQARAGSTRLPGKVLLPLAGRPLLARMIERVSAARSPFDLVVATTTLGEDDAIVQVCRAAGVDVFRGHPTDLLDRHWRAAEAAKADVVVKIPSDCPLIDPAIVDRVLDAHASSGADYTSNLHPASYPDGFDVEAMSAYALETAWREAQRPHEREHTTPFLWDQPQRFRVHNVAWETGRDLSMTHRLVVDYPEDYRLVRDVFDALWTPSRRVFDLGDVLAWLDAHPQARRINERLVGVNWYRHHLGELRTIRAEDTRSPETTL